MASRELSILVKAKGAIQASKDVGKVDSAVHHLGVRSIALGSAIGTGLERLAEKGISTLFGAIQSGEESLHQLQDITAQTGAVIESTGGKAGVTAQQVRDLAQAQESLTTVDDKAIQSGENLLLTFTGIGKDVFPQATKAMVDMAVAMNGGNAEGLDLTNTAVQIGKALNDPIKGVGALRRVGVQLTDQQQKQITTLLSLTKDEQEHYNSLRKTDKAAAERYKQTQIGSRLSQAQTIILKELNTEFGKAGEAAGKSGAAGVRRLSDAVEDAKMALAEGLAPALENIRGQLAAALSNPSTQADLRHLGEWLGDAATQGLAFVKSIPWGQVADGLKTAAGFAGGLVKAFTNMPPQVQAALLGLAGLNKLSGGAVGSLVGELGKGLIKGVLGMNAAVVNINAGAVNGGGLPGVVGGGGKLGSALRLILPIGIGLAIGEALGPYVTPAFVEAVNAARKPTVTNTKTGQTVAQLAIGARTGGLSPEERDTQSKLDRVRTSAEQNRIALQSSIRTGDSQIVAALRNLSFNLNLSLAGGGRTTTRVTSGTTLHRTLSYSGKLVPL